jgi:hypothetical protein
MKKMNLLLIACLLYMSLSALDNVIIGKYRKFESKILGREVTYLEHLPDGYEKSDKNFPVLFIMNDQIISQVRNIKTTISVTF